MKITKIKIKNLFGITECELDGSSVELVGTNGAGKTSVLDAIRYALTNDSQRDFIIRQGETTGEIIIETDTGLSVTRMKREGQVDYKSVKDGRNIVSSPESYLKSLFSELQINPVAFILMSKKEQNRAILDLIEFAWDLNWIKEQFGEIPSGVNYEQNILQVLHDIQSETGDYFMARQDLNRDIRNKRAFIDDIASKIPVKYDAEKWERFDTAEAYKRLTEAQHHNDLIARAEAFRAGFDGKMRGYEADREIAITAAEKAIDAERSELTATIARLEAEITAAKDKIASLASKLDDKKKVAQSEYEAKVAKLKSDMGLAEEYYSASPIDVVPIKEEITIAEEMRSHLSDYHRMIDLESAVKDLSAQSAELTRKIELARSLPGIILQTATIPVEGLTVVDGVPYIKGMPVSNLSEGEKLELCVDVAVAKPGGLQIILIDGIEKLSEENRTKLYEKCKSKGIQFIATRTTDDPDLRVITL